MVSSTFAKLTKSCIDFVSHGDILENNIQKRCKSIRCAPTQRLVNYTRCIDDISSCGIQDAQIISSPTFSLNTTLQDTSEKRKDGSETSVAHRCHVTQCQSIVPDYAKIQNPAPTLKKAIIASASVLATDLAPVERELDGVAEALARTVEDGVCDALSEDCAEDEGDCVLLAMDADCDVLVNVFCDVNVVEDRASTVEDRDSMVEDKEDEAADADDDRAEDEADEEALTTVVSILDTATLL